MSFDEYLDWRVNSDLKFQKEFVYNESGELLVELVGKVERIQLDFDRVCDKVGISRRILGVRNKSIHKPYTEYYDSQTRQIIQEVFSEDIKLFNYTFES